MSTENPIDVDEYEYDELKLEDEDIYGDQVKCEPDKSDFPEPETFKSGKKGKSPYARGSNRRHPKMRIQKIEFSLPLWTREDGSNPHLRI